MIMAAFGTQRGVWSSGSKVSFLLWLLTLVAVLSGPSGRAPTVNVDAVKALRELLKGRVAKSLPLKLRGGHEMVLRGGENADLRRHRTRELEVLDSHELNDAMRDKFASSVPDSMHDGHDLDLDEHSAVSLEASADPLRPGRKQARGNAVLSGRSGSRSAASSRTTSPMDARDDTSEAGSNTFWGMMDRINHLYHTSARRAAGLPVDGFEGGSLEKDFFAGDGETELVPHGRDAQVVVKSLGSRFGVQSQPRPAEGEKSELGLARARARLAEATASLQDPQPMVAEEDDDKESGGDEFSEEEAQALKSELKIDEDAGPPQYRSMVIRNIPDHTSQQHIMELMEEYGPVQHVYLHPLKYFAHVLFKDRESLEFALQHPVSTFLGSRIEFKRTQLVNPFHRNWRADASTAGEFNDGIVPKKKYEANSRVLIERPARPKQAEKFLPGYKTTVRDFERVETLWVDTDENGQLIMPPFLENTAVIHNLSPNCTIEEVAFFFRRCGTIVESSIEDAIEGVSKFAQLQFSNYSSMEKACMMDGEEMGGRALRVRERGRTLPLVEDRLEQASFDVHEDQADKMTCKRGLGGKSRK